MGLRKERARQEAVSASLFVLPGMFDVLDVYAGAVESIWQVVVVN